jgi:hypothetical protein
MSSAPKRVQSSSSSDETDYDLEAKIHQQVIARKRQQNLVKAQPWKGKYVPDPSDVPKFLSPFEKPWLQEESDTGADTAGGQN